MDSRQLNPNMRLESSGELLVDTNIVEDFIKQLCKTTNTENTDDAIARIRKESRTRIQMKSTFHKEVFSVPKSVVKVWTRSMSLVSVPGLYSDLDLEKGKYEGGFKVWESTNDLVKFVTQDQGAISDVLSRANIRILELGAGAALPSLAILSRIINDPNSNSTYRIHLQDYNWQVLASLTLMNFAVNLHPDYMKALIETKTLRLFYGDWADFRKESHYKYDLIMMSEAIYNSDNYESLHNLIDSHLKKKGYIVIATKNTYFGLSGGLYSWLDYADRRNKFVVDRVLRITSTNIPRSILVMRRSKNV